jgi:branched-chain amino acid transport system permease protein
VSGGADPGHQRWLIAALVAASIVFPLVAPNDYWIGVATRIGLYATLALGLNVVVGFAGLLDLGYVAFFGIGSYVYAFLASPHFGLHWPTIAVLPIVLVATALAGILIGAPTLRLRGDYLAIVTLGFGEITYLLLINLDRPINITGGPSGIVTIDPPSFLGWTATRNGQYYYLFLAAAAVALFVSARLRNSRIGRAWEAVREDEVAARAMGINTTQIKLLAFAMGASFGGVAGGMFSAIQGFISPESFVLVESIMVLAMVVLGGMGNIWGVILGAVLLSFVPEILRFTVEPVQRSLFGRMLVEPEVIRMLIFGFALVLIMILRPGGLWPSAVRRRELAARNGDLAR